LSAVCDDKKNRIHCCGNKNRKFGLSREEIAITEDK